MQYDSTLPFILLSMQWSTHITEDPVAISEPCCPNSLTKFLLDVFSDRSTSGMFYTTDMMVLIDIVTRQLSDLGPGEEVRSERDWDMGE